MPRTSFSPYLHGFKFANYFANHLANLPGFGQITTYGRCGGIAYAALDYYFAGLAVPTEAALPADGVPLADYIYDRLLATFVTPSAINFVIWSLLPDGPSWFNKGVSLLTREDEFPRLQSQLDLGHPQVLGLIDARDIAHIGDNHQVVAYGYDVAPGGVIQVYIYDNNTPNQEVVLTLVPGQIGMLASNKAGGWRGFFVQGYGPAYPPYLLDGSLVKETSNPDTYVLYKGGKFLIPTQDEFDAMNYNPARIQDMPDGSLAYISDAPGDGSLFQEHNQTFVNIVYGGARFPIQDVTGLTALGFTPAAVRPVPAGAMAAVSQVPRDYTLLRELSSASIYQVKGGLRCMVPGSQAFNQLGLVWGNVRVVPDNALAALPDGGMMVV